MNKENILSLVKAKLGITTDIRDIYIKAIIEAVVQELEEEAGLSLKYDSPYNLMFIVDYAAWRYSNKNDAMPRHLKFRLNNLFLHCGGKKQ